VSADTGTGRLTASNARHALFLACAQAGLSAESVELLRLGENALFVLPREHLVARIARAVGLRDRVTREREGDHARR
jgi:hypothetical protein